MSDKEQRRKLRANADIFAAARHLGFSVRRMRELAAEYVIPFNRDDRGRETFDLDELDKWARDERQR